jgi:hypothetical protein
MPDPKKLKTKSGKKIPPGAPDPKLNIEKINLTTKNCLECGKEIVGGTFCSVKCTNLYKSKDPEFLKKLSNSIKKYHAELTPEEKSIRSKSISNGNKNFYLNQDESSNSNTGFLQSYNNFKKAHSNRLEIITPFEEYKTTRKIEVQCKECGAKFSCRKSTSKFSGIICRSCVPGGSKGEQEMRELFEFTHVENRTLIYPLELDLVNIDKKFAVEFNGIYWHSDLFKNEDYHLNKTEACENIDIQLFHIFENEWYGDRKNIWISMINQKLGLSNRLYARKCTIKEIPYKEAKEFLDINHLQGTSVSSINLGLFYEEELVSLMTFGKPRFNKNYEWELIRFCNKLNHTVIGGASKLLRFFERKYNPKSIISYADRNHSNGELYHNLEFFFLKNTSPNYFWIYEGKILKRYNTQKHKLKEILGESFDENLSENSNLYTSGAMKYYDAGNRVYIKEYTR